MTFSQPSDALRFLAKQHAAYLAAQDGSTVANCFVCGRNITNKELYGTTGATPDAGSTPTCIDCMDAMSKGVQ